MITTAKEASVYGLCRTCPYKGGPCELCEARVEIDPAERLRRDVQKFPNVARVKRPLNWAFSSVYMDIEAKLPLSIWENERPGWGG